MTRYRKPYTWQVDALGSELKRTTQRTLNMVNKLLEQNEGMELENAQLRADNKVLRDALEEITSGDWDAQYICAYEALEKTKESAE